MYYTKVKVIPKSVSSAILKDHLFTKFQKIMCYLYNNRESYVEKYVTSYNFFTNRFITEEGHEYTYAEPIEITQTTYLKNKETIIRYLFEDAYSMELNRNDIYFTNGDKIISIDVFLHCGKDVKDIPIEFISQFPNKFFHTKTTSKPISFIDIDTKIFGAF